MSADQYDAVIVGAGPNGLSAAIELARASLSVLVLEAQSTPGGGARTQELTRPGFSHDVCSAVHPLGAASPFFKSLGLERDGLSWIQPKAPLAHVLSEDRVILLERSVEETAAQLGADAAAYSDLLSPFVNAFDELLPMILAPLRFPTHPLLMARFGVPALRSMAGLAKSLFSGSEATALLGGMAAHAMLPLESLGTASFALVLASAGHAVGWPIARGGSATITKALVGILSSLGGTLELNRCVGTMAELPHARAYVFDLTPQQLIHIAGERLPASYRARLARFRYGPGVFKIDWALNGPVPWRDPRCARAATVHLSGGLPEVAAAQRLIPLAKVAAQPFTLFVQPSLFDPTRAPASMHTAWAYCHVPSGSTFDATDAIENHVERFAPGFKAQIAAKSAKTALEMERYNANYVGGDINGGAADLGQLFFRPTSRLDPYSTPAPDIFLCSSSTPPGGGVHGMCGYWAARSVLRKLFPEAAQATRSTD